jgi:hypothetical protein
MDVPWRAAKWFALVGVVHTAMNLAVCYRFSAAIFDSTPLVWFALAGGLYLRLGPIRRIVLLFGVPLIAIMIVLAMLTLTGAMDVQPITICGVAISDASSAWQIVHLLLIAAVFLYPVCILWPTSTRASFRDRLGRR